MTVEQEVLNAYADCGLIDEKLTELLPEWSKGERSMTNEEKEKYYEIEPDFMNLRDLQFRASRAVKPETAYKIMKRACEGYNDFDCELIKLFPDDCKIAIAREGSVCLYIQPGKKRLPTCKALKADEYDVLKEDQRRACSAYRNGRYHAEDKSIAVEGRPDVYGGYKGEVRIWWD